MRRKIPVLVSLIFLMVSCGLNPFNSDPDDRIFQITVDSLTVASPLAVSDTMNVRFHGVIGTSCETFSHFDVTRIDLFRYNQVRYIVSVWGKNGYIVGTGGLLIDVGRPCPGEKVIYLNQNHNLTFYPPLRVGTWIFLVSQPDGSVLRKEVVVRG